MQKFLLFLIIFALGFYIWINNQKHETTVSTKPQVSPSPTVKPTPTPLPIPKHSGRQVRVPILTYHYIGNNPNPQDLARDALQVPPDKFEEQMNYLATNGYTPISLNSLHAALKGGDLPSKPVVLTFDDGYIDFYYNAFPILKKYRFVAISFIPTGLVGKGYYMSWDQIKEIDSIGLVAFESHSVDHINSVSLTANQLDYQLSESKRVLEEQLGKKVNFFAYPYGLSDETTWQAVREAGYLGGVGTWYGNIVSEGVVFDMPRIKISGGMDLATFASRL